MSTALPTLGPCCDADSAGASELDTMSGWDRVARPHDSEQCPLSHTIPSSAHTIPSSAWHCPTRFRAPSHTIPSSAWHCPKGTVALSERHWHCPKGTVRKALSESGTVRKRRTVRKRSAHECTPHPGGGGGGRDDPKFRPCPQIQAVPPVSGMRRETGRRK